MSVTFETGSRVWHQSNEPYLYISLTDGRKITIIKEDPINHIRADHGPNCTSTVIIKFASPSDSQIFEDSCKAFVRIKTCDYAHAYVDDKTCNLRLNPENALKALKVCETKWKADIEWFEKAKEFIKNGPVPEKQESEKTENKGPDASKRIEKILKKVAAEEEKPSHSVIWDLFRAITGPFFKLGKY